MRKKIVVVDDTPEDRKRLTKRLAKDKTFNVVAVPPPEISGIRAITSEKPALVLIDYTLTGKEEGRPQVNYKGTSLAGFLREKLPDVPLVLVTRQSMLRKGATAGRDVEGAYDDFISKEGLLKSSSGLAALSVLMRGFELLAAVKNKTWSALMELVGADEQEEALLKESLPPNGIVSERAWRTPETARWIRNVVLRYPGVIYDTAYAATSIGIEPEGLDTTGLRRMFSSARYAGPFSAEGQFFWRIRFHDIARKYLQANKRDDATLATFGEVWNAKHKKRVKIARCNTSDNSPADTLCYVLEEPVLRRFSLPYLPDNRPDSMDEARVSFKAIRTSNDFDERLLPPDALALVAEIQADA
jgi:CheY-like chemotaxis protein